MVQTFHVKEYVERLPHARVDIARRDAADG
jgi:hypothetical protein